MIPPYQTDDYEALVSEWNRTTSKRRYRRSVKGATTNELETSDSEADISKLRKRFMVDKQYENTMVTAPLTIYLLGKLMVHSSLADFSLRSFRDNWPFKRIRSPESFRATLAQIANDGWNAFMGAHSAMNKIQLNMQQIPQHLRTARRIIKADISYELLSRLLPKTLRHVTRIGDECKTSSAKASNVFEDVYLLLQEVEEATLASDKGHATERKKIHDEYNNTRIIMAEKEKLKKDLDHELAEAKTLVQNARHELSNALGKIPTGFNAIINELCYTIVDFIGDVGSAISGRRGSIDGSSMSGTGPNTVSFAVTETESCIKGFGKSLELLIKAVAKKKGASLDTLSHFKTGFDMWHNINQNVTYNEKKNQAAQLIDRGIEAIVQMTSSVKKGRNVKNENKQQFIVLRSDVESFLAQQVSTTNNNPVSNFNAPKERATDTNPKFIVAVRQQELRYIEKTYEDRYNALRKLTHEVGDMIGRMARLDSDEIQFKDILEVLHKAVKLLAEIKTNWNGLTIFFKTIAQEIELSIDSILAPVLDHAEGAISPIKEERDRKFLLAAIDRLGKPAVDESHLIFLLSRTYVDISRKYIMEKLAGLSRLMFMTTKDEREVELNKLKNEESKMEETVRELIGQRRRIFQEHVDKQQRELKKLNQQFAESDEDNQQMSDQDQDLLNTNV